MLISQTQEPRIVATAHIAQTMTFLNMPAEEVLEKVQNELANNPALEYIDRRICPHCNKPIKPNTVCQCMFGKQKAETDNIFFISPRDELAVEYYRSGGSGLTSGTEPDSDSAQHEDLAMYVMRQIGADLEEDEKMIAAHLLTGLDDDGFITASVYDLAVYYHVSPDKIQSVIDTIQLADPIGVGCANPQEALLLQIRHLKQRMSIPFGAEEVIRDSFEELLRKKYREITEAHGLTLKQISLIETFMGENLNPFPGRSLWGDRGIPNESEVEVFHYPDIIVSYLNDKPENPLVTEIVMPISGYLRVNREFKNAIKEAPEEKADEWKNDLDRASLMVKSLTQRNNTMVQLMKKIVAYQESFIRNGDSEMAAITRAEIAKELNVHESTISRAVANKTVMLPNRKVIPLSTFFDRSLSVRTVIRDLINQETKPLTDAKIVELLKGMGYDIARRTVAKYRAMEGILPARLRTGSNAK